MPTVTFIESNGTAHVVEAAPNRNLMQAALDNAVPGILGDCGGSCSCATCHAHVDPAWLPLLPAMGETETFMLEGVIERDERSRLCCQIKLTAELDGIVLNVPVGQY